MTIIFPLLSKIVDMSSIKILTISLLIASILLALTPESMTFAAPEFDNEEEGEITLSKEKEAENAKEEEMPAKPGNETAWSPPAGFGDAVSTSEVTNAAAGEEEKPSAEKNEKEEKKETDTSSDLLVEDAKASKSDDVQVDELDMFDSEAVPSKPKRTRTRKQKQKKEPIEIEPKTLEQIMRDVKLQRDLYKYKKVEGVDKGEEEEGDFKLDHEQKEDVVPETIPSDEKEEKEKEKEKETGKEKEKELEGEEGKVEAKPADADAKGGDADAEIKAPKNETERVLVEKKGKYDVVPAVIVEGHEEVLKYWFAAVENGLLNITKGEGGATGGATLLHIDSHADMAPSKPLTARWPKYPAEWEEDGKIGLNTFILPAVHAHLVSHVVWIRPPWGNQQLPDCIRKPVTLSVDPTLKGVARWKISLESNYYESANVTWHGNYTGSSSSSNVSEGVGKGEGEGEGEIVSASPYQLIDQTDFILSIVCIDDIVSGKVKLRDVVYGVGVKPEGEGEGEDTTQLIIDIDEDFFSTRNPDYSVLRNHVGVESAQYLVSKLSFDQFCLSKIPKKRQWQQELWMLALAGIANRHLYEKSKEKFIYGTSFVHKLFCKEKQGVEVFGSLHDIFVKYMPRQKYKSSRARHEAIKDCLGRLFQAANLPHKPHRSMDEIKISSEDMALALETLNTPQLVTIARSVDHMYTPVRSWPVIENAILESLHTLYQNVKVYWSGMLGKPPVPKEGDRMKGSRRLIHWYLDSEEFKRYDADLEDIDTEDESDEPQNVEEIMEWLNDPRFIQYAKESGQYEQVQLLKKRMEDPYFREMMMDKNFREAMFTAGQEKMTKDEEGEEDEEGEGDGEDNWDDDDLFPQTGPSNSRKRKGKGKGKSKPSSYISDTDSNTSSSDDDDDGDGSSLSAGDETDVSEDEDEGEGEGGDEPWTAFPKKEKEKKKIEEKVKKEKGKEKEKVKKEKVKKDKVKPSVEHDSLFPSDDDSGESDGDGSDSEEGESEEEGEGMGSGGVKDETLV